MESQKFSQTQYKIVYLISQINKWDDNFLGNNAASKRKNLFFEIQCPKDFCDFGLFNRLAQAGGGGALLYDISLPKTYRPKLLLPS